jgi:TolB-like protein/DNA-binding SARP family transcriptional activator/Tfp pilus assembly protein PilF
VSHVTPVGKNGKAATRSNGSRETCRIHLLGAMRVIGPSGNDLLPAAKKTQALLAYLCLSQGERLSRMRLASLLWDRSGEAQALDALRHALHDLYGSEASWRLDRERHGVRLDTTDCWIDAFESPERPDQLLRDLYGLSTAFDHWLIGERVRFEGHWQSLLEQKLDELISQRAPPAARAAAARQLLTVVPAHERAVRSLMTAFVDMDDSAEAIREFERQRQIAEISGVPLSQQTITLYEAIRLRPRITTTRAPEEPQVASEAPAPPTEADFEPSIAVLPFRNLSGDRSQDFVAEGLTEDLVEALSRVPGLFVISRLSSAMYRKQDRPLRDIGAALGVRYVLSGSVRVNGDRLRLVAELAEPDTGKALWRSRFDERCSDLLDLQDGLAEEVVSRVGPQLRSAELKRVRIKRPEDYTAYDFFLRAQESMHSPNRVVFEGSEKLFDLALAREPHYATVLAWRAYWHVLRVGQGWSRDRAADTEQAELFARRAIECDELEPMAFAVQGHVAGYLHKDFDLAFGSFETALQINPNSARAWLWHASADAWVGNGSGAVEKIKRAMALSPYDPLISAYTASASMAHLAAGEYSRAIEFALRCISENPGYTSPRKLLIMSLALDGREEEARAPLNQLLRLEPNFSVQQFRRRFPGSDHPIAELCCDALARAGVPALD